MDAAAANGFGAAAGRVGALMGVADLAWITFGFRAVTAEGRALRALAPSILNTATASVSWTACTV